MPTPVAPPSPRPNLILISCDQLRADWLGCNGHPLVQSPQIDKLAAKGVNFRRALSECPMCVPARRIMMTGLDSHRLGLFDNRDTLPFPQGPKLAELVTRAGWQTHAVGKLHTSPPRARLGFEDAEINEEGRRQEGLAIDDYERFLADHGQAHLAHSHGLGNNQYGMRLSPLEAPYTTTQWTADRAMAFLERRDPTRPFFLHVSFDKPHPPLTPLPAYYELYRDAVFPEPSHGAWADSKVPSRVQHLRGACDWPAVQADPRFRQQCFRAYAALITQIDSAIGNLLGQLREMGEIDRTWIIFVSDHGDHLFDHGNFAKGDFFRGSTSVPYIVTPPAQVTHGQPGRLDEHTPAMLADLMPTILDILGIPVPAGLCGQSLLPHITDPAAPARELAFGRSATAYCVSDGRHRYQWFGDDDLEFLFDVGTDPAELHDLTTEPAAAPVLHRLRAELDGWLTRQGDERWSGTARRALPHDWKLHEGRSRNFWNNRGRH